MNKPQAEKTMSNRWSLSKVFLKYWGAALPIAPGLRRRWVMMGVFAVLVSGCAGTTTRVPISSAPRSPNVQVPAAAAHAPTPDQQRLRAEVNQWIGTPHRMGGTSREGIDCSGFVQRVYKDIYHRNIPRSTRLQVRVGEPVDKKQLRPGDLVFFKIPFKGRHVGIYLGREEFAHASTSKGVVISSLKEDYWRSHYWTARHYPL
jgi:cell wall-associated NlpC family hydrolase